MYEAENELKIHDVYTQIGASNHSVYGDIREKDNFYSTDPIAIDLLFTREKQKFIGKKILEPMCGDGSLSKRLEQLLNVNVDSYDLFDRGYGVGDTDYLTTDFRDKYDIIITNPPYCTDTVDMIIKAIHDVKQNGIVYMFLKLTFLETWDRYSKLYIKYPPSRIYQFVERLRCARGGGDNFEPSAIAYTWQVWDTNAINQNTELLWLTKRGL